MASQEVQERTKSRNRLLARIQKNLPPFSEVLFFGKARVFVLNEVLKCWQLICLASVCCVNCVSSVQLCVRDLRSSGCGNMEYELTKNTLIYLKGYFCIVHFEDVDFGFQFMHTTEAYSFSTILKDTKSLHSVPEPEVEQIHRENALSKKCEPISNEIPQPSEEEPELLPISSVAVEQMTTLNTNNEFSADRRAATHVTLYSTADIKRTTAEEEIETARAADESFEMVKASPPAKDTHFLEEILKKKGNLSKVSVDKQSPVVKQESPLRNALLRRMRAQRYSTESSEDDFLDHDDDWSD